MVLVVIVSWVVGSPWPCKRILRMTWSWCVHTQPYLAAILLGNSISWGEHVGEDRQWAWSVSCSASIRGGGRSWIQVVRKKKEVIFNRRLPLTFIQNHANRLPYFTKSHSIFQSRSFPMLLVSDSCNASYHNWQPMLKHSICISGGTIEKMNLVSYDVHFHELFTLQSAYNMLSSLRERWQYLLPFCEEKCP